MPTAAKKIQRFTAYKLKKANYGFSFAPPVAMLLKQKSITNTAAHGKVTGIRLQAFNQSALQTNT